MHADTIVALIAVITAVITAVIVPWMTFRLALRQDQARWLREQRTQLYVDMLTEAYAEQKYIEWATADDETRERTREYFTSADVRLPPLERARLGARGTIFASRTVNQLFNQIGSEGMSAVLKPQRGMGGADDGPCPRRPNAGQAAGRHPQRTRGRSHHARDRPRHHRSQYERSGNGSASPVQTDNGYLGSDTGRIATNSEKSR